MNKRFTNTVLESILSSFEMQVVIIDQKGVIQMANKAWLEEGPKNNQAAIGTNYLAICPNSMITGEEEKRLALEGIKSVLAGKTDRFELEYPCDSEISKRWFLMKVYPLAIDGLGAMIVHEEVTSMKQSLQKLEHFAQSLKKSKQEQESSNERLLEKSQLLKASIQLARLGTWNLDLLSNRITPDDLSKTIFEISPEVDFIKFEDFIRWIHPEDQGDLLKNFEEAIVSGNSWNKVYRLFTGSGAMKYISTEAQAVVNDQGTVVRIICVSQDITQQEEVKDQLAKSEEKAKILFDYSPIIIWEEDFSEVKIFIDELKNKGIKDFRKYFEEFPHLSEELANKVVFTQVNKTSLEFYDVNSKDELVQNLGDWFVDDSWELFTNELIALAEGKSEFEGEVKVITSKKEIKTLYLKLSVPPQYLNSLEVVLISFIDITALKNNEKLILEKEQKIREYSNQLEQKVIERTKELSQSENKLKVAQRIAQIGYFEWDILTNELDWSDELYKIYGLKKGTIKYLEDIFKYIHPEDIDIAKSTLAKVKSQIVPQPINFRIILPDGKLKHIYVTSQRPLMNRKGELIKIVGINQDVTQVKKLENMQTQVEGVLQGQESERERIAGELHDSINPLLSLASLNIESALDDLSLDDGSLEEKLGGSIAILQSAIEGIREISQNLSPAALKNFGLVVGIEQLCNKMRMMEIFKVDCRVHDMKERLSFEIELALYRISQELLNNILKHAQASEVELQLIRHPDSIILMISDNGIGFDVEAQNHKKDGFGLRSVHSRVEALKGNITIDAAETIGTTTIVEIPI